MYGNEREVGHTLRSYLKNHPELTRKDIFYTSKLASNKSYDATRASIKSSVKEAGLSYIDLFLIHSPYGGRKARKDCFRAVLDAVKDGEVKSAGVSNFGVRHLEELLEDVSEAPAVNQIEVHPFNTQTDIVEFCQSRKIVVEAYAPLVRAMRMKHPLLVELSKKYGCSPGQLLVAWSLAKGFVTLPKSVKKARILENADVNGIELAEEDVKRLDDCDEHLVTGKSTHLLNPVEDCRLIFRRLGSH
jgi:diketogulonate reductase-like aldo/keto reductase